MITVEEARALVFGTTRDFGIESISLMDAVGRTLREPLIADRDFPPYDRVTMDGIAIRFADFTAGNRTFKIAGVGAAGQPQMSLSKTNTCLEIMTGAILPTGADAIIRYEDLQIQTGDATITAATIRDGQNIHRKGSDRLRGSVLLQPGYQLNAAAIGIAATIGKDQLRVSKLPKVLIISTGDELVNINEKPLPHQIRKSNVYQLQAGLKHFGIFADHRHLNDNLKKITENLRHFLIEYDAVLLSGGVSKGKFDFLPEAMDQLGVKKLFHKIKQRPGKPFWFGQYPEGATVFAFPGNPVSSFMCAQIYCMPWLQKCLGLPVSYQQYASLTAPIHFKPDLTYFAQVKINTDKFGKLLATPIEGNGSGDLANLVEANAFLEVPMGKDIFEKEMVLPFFKII